MLSNFGRLKFVGGVWGGFSSTPLLKQGVAPGDCNRWFWLFAWYKGQSCSWFVVGENSTYPLIILADPAQESFLSMYDISILDPTFSVITFLCTDDQLFILVSLHTIPNPDFLTYA